jgi:hypothetical protein
MQSPVPQKQKIAGRPDSSEDTKEKEEAFDIIENIGAITEDDKKEAESDSSDSTITEVKDSPETEGGSIKLTVTEAVSNNNINI